MSSNLHINPKNNNRGDTHLNENNDLSSTFDRSDSIARLGSSPGIPNIIYDSSPSRSILSNRTTGINDLDRVMSTSNLNLCCPLSQATFNPEDNTMSVDLPDDEVAKVVKRHLVGTSPTASFNANLSVHDNLESEDEGTSNITSVHQLAGGAITSDIYKWAEDAGNGTTSRRQRSQSFHLPRSEPVHSSLARLKNPGGFRRHFIVSKAESQGRSPPHWMTRTFVDFLALYGHFGGEDLSDDDDEEGEDLFVEEGLRRRRRRSEDVDDEESPLIRKAQENVVQGTATPAKAVFLLLKSFVGTGVMFLPKAFSNGGLLFSTSLLSFIALISLYSFLLLVETRNKIPVSFGDIGGILFGKYMRFAVLLAITLSQVGFVCAYMVFVAQNVQALIESLSQCEATIPLSYLILSQIAIFVPLAMIRRIQKLSAFALIADVFILIGLIYLYYFDFYTLSTNGISNIDWVLNAKSFPMFIGTAVFTYEGVGLVIPITESMAQPEKFPRVLCGTLMFITSIFLSVGVISYLAFGNEVKTVILLNMPPSPVVNTIQGLYALAICLSIPLQLFPAIRIIENGLFSRSGKHNIFVKWQKNIFRFIAVLMCAVVAIAGSGDLDKFVSLVGSFCCVPLCFLFPPLFHLKAIAKTWSQRAIDISIIIFGVLSMSYTTVITIALWSSGGEPEPISRCPL